MLLDLTVKQIKGLIVFYYFFIDNVGFNRVKNINLMADDLKLLFYICSL